MIETLKGFLPAKVEGGGANSVSIKQIRRVDFFQITIDFLIRGTVLLVTRFCHECETMYRTMTD